MSSKVTLCNLALARLGAARITSLTDGTETANLCNTLFDDIAEEVMSEGPWTSTINRASLNATTNTPAFGFTKEFQLPTNPKCLKVISINEDDPGTYNYRIEGDKLLANLSTIKIEYIGKITDTESYDVYLKRAIVQRLVSELAYPITGDRGVAEGAFQQYKLAVAEGLSSDGQQGAKDTMPSSDLIDVR